VGAETSVSPLQQEHVVKRIDVCIVASLALLAACNERPLPTATATPGLSADGSADLEPGPFGLGVFRLHDLFSPCRAPVHHQFDFWVGSWEIRDPAGGPAGTSVVTRDVAGCAVEEHFSAANGFQGRSLSAYDHADGRWHQSFVGAGGTNLRIAGGLARFGAMVMSGTQPDFGGDKTQQDEWYRITRDSVRQIVLQSFDDGLTSDTSFDGRYLRRGHVTPPPPLELPYCTLIPGFGDLDFAVGQWTARRGARPVAHAAVTKDLNGCLVDLRLTTPRGYEAHSYLFFDFFVERWFRVFVDNRGHYLELSGPRGEDALVLTGTTADHGGHALTVRNSWTPTRAGGFTQTWEVSGDGGATWSAPVTVSFGN
jgi:hypothetical protein